MNNEGGKLLIGDVAFKTRAEMDKCAKEAGDEWDSEEIYFVIDEIKKQFPNVDFTQKSFCAGIIEMER